MVPGEEEFRRPEVVAGKEKADRPEVVTGKEEAGCLPEVVACEENGKASLSALVGVPIAVALAINQSIRGSTLVQHPRRTDFRLYIRRLYQRRNLRTRCASCGATCHNTKSPSPCRQ